MGNIASVPTPRTCGICFEDKLPVQSSLYKNNPNCPETHPFCQDCIAKHILYKIEAKTAIVRCPGIECPAILEPVGCRSLIPRNSFVQWCDILVDAFIASRGHKRAVCPYEGCSEVVVDECRGGARQECPICKGAFCFGCGVEWTTNHHETCSFEERVFLNVAQRQNWKRCPRCRFFIQLRSGCNSITCRCGATFCYKCGAERCRCYGIMSRCMQAFLVLCLVASAAFLFYELSR